VPTRAASGREKRPGMGDTTVSHGPHLHSSLPFCLFVRAPLCRAIRLLAKHLPTDQGRRPATGSARRSDPRRSQTRRLRHLSHVGGRGSVDFGGHTKGGRGPMPDSARSVRPARTRLRPGRARPPPYFW
jgi:hypothetical protein